MYIKDKMQSIDKYLFIKNTVYKIREYKCYIICMYEHMYVPTNSM